MSFSPPPDLQSVVCLPTWESHYQYPTPDPGFRFAIRRNPYRHMVWQKVRDDAVKVRYWNLVIEIQFGRRRWLWWHFVERTNRSLKYGVS